MYTASSTSQPATGGVFAMLRRGEGWLDDRGRKAWIAAMILGFVFAWPVGLGLLGYMIWSKRMFGRHSCGMGRQQDNHDQMHKHWHETRSGWRDMGRAMRPSGNSAFDTYKADTIRRLQDEHRRSRRSCNACAMPRTSRSLTRSWMTAPRPTLQVRRSRTPFPQPEAANTETARTAPSGGRAHSKGPRRCSPTRVSPTR